MKHKSQSPSRRQLELRHIHKQVQTSRGKVYVLDDVNLKVAQGELLCLLGPSGSGKSALFDIIAGLEPPDTGQVLLEGRPVTEPGPDLGVVFHDNALFPWLTVEGNVAFGLSLLQIPPAERRKRVREALEMVRLTRFAGRYMHELSPGMRGRVAIARALVMRPKVLLMDEPFAALDAQTRNVMQEELQQIWLKTRQTVIFVTHNVSEAIRLGDRIAVLSFRPGRIKREVRIQRPRPRLADDPHLLEIRAFLVRELMEESHAAVEEELGDA